MFQSIPGVLHLQTLRGHAASGPPTVLIEVPHGADERQHYDALAGTLKGPLPDDLHIFFHMNTDVGAWALGLQIAQRLIAADPSRCILLIRCLIPRTFIDCNRVIQAQAEDLQSGGLTAAIPPYISDKHDKKRLLSLYSRYRQVVDEAFEQVCGSGGFALIPHSYGPRSVGIKSVDLDIVDKLRWAHEPQRYSTWPLRAPVDLITHTPEGKCLAPTSLVQSIIGRYQSDQVEAIANHTYTLHPSAMGSHRAMTYPQQTLCFEVRRDLLVEEWTPFCAMTLRPGAIARFAEPVARSLSDWLS